MKKGIILAAVICMFVASCKCETPTQQEEVPTATEVVDTAEVVSEADSLN